MLLGMAGEEWMGLGWFLFVVSREQANNLFDLVPVMAEVKILPFLIDVRFSIFVSPLDNGGNLRMSRHFLMTPCCLDIVKIAIVTSDGVAA